MEYRILSGVETSNDLSGPSGRKTLKERQMKVETGASTYKVENKAVIRPRMETNKYPFDKMKVGQSFYFEPASVNHLMKIRGAAAHFGNRHGMKFSVVRDGEGFRCGRI